MYSSNFAKSTENRKVIAKEDIFAVVEYLKDYKASPQFAAEEYFAVRSNMHRHQLIANINNRGVISRYGRAGIILGGIDENKAFSKQPRMSLYNGCGVIVFDSTYRHFIFQDIEKWNGGIEMPYDFFVACTDKAVIKTETDNTVEINHLNEINSVGDYKYGFDRDYGEYDDDEENSTIVHIEGSGKLVLSSPMPETEFVVIELKEDNMIMAGYQALAWSGTLKAEEIEVNNIHKTKFSGTGKILLIPLT